ncbi:hypothetical protein E2R51_11110 [Jeotgalibacillus sp. S-D1]|uniref:hypothetical protein n=1 Tax=Jeotgalibacillus sp. S-D1 TaxID=2552189 RepID=UPI001059AA42|nr:hypothetical protein [Jeotgalibacillus sp. S-D1]TDL31767.1 hypothetical protein E2R51_11110 [Jeotgalibacillus sp. S-D1]
MNDDYYVNYYPYYEGYSYQDDRIFPPGGGGGSPFPGGGGGGGFPFPGGGGGFPFPGGGGSGGGFPFPGGGGGNGGGSQFPGGGGGSVQNMSAPTGPPPSQIPPKPFQAQGAQAFFVDPDLIRPCLFRFTYVWLNNGASFWFYPILTGRNSVGGFYWNSRQFRWSYIALDTRSIDVVSC